jgi:hypothetical protein
MLSDSSEDCKCFWSFPAPLTVKIGQDTEICVWGRALTTTSDALFPFAELDAGTGKSFDRRPIKRLIFLTWPLLLSFPDRVLRFLVEFAKLFCYHIVIAPMTR